MVIEWVVANKELFKILYALVILFICSFIVIKADRLFKISDYQGIRYFRNAFFFFGLAIIARFILGPVSTTNNLIYSDIINFLFQFLILVGTLFLIYSLIWKRLEKVKKYHSLFNISALVFYLIAFIISYLSLLLKFSLIFYLSQIFFLLVILIISLKNWIVSGKEHSFLRTYSLAILIWLFAWLIEGAKITISMENEIIPIVIYGLNIIFFLLFLRGVGSLSNENKKR